ncbi:MAG: hypothetical protein WD887_02765 [Candidatus Saccharimonadales bacterium]
MARNIIDRMVLPRHLLTWALVPLFIFSSLICIFALRGNNHTMVQLRSEVYAADKNDGDVSKVLDNLRIYVYSHMNTDLSSGGNAIKPPIQLKHTYERLVQAEAKRVERANDKTYNDAKNLCEARHPIGVPLTVRAACVQDYVSKRGVKATPIPVALYQFDFISPAWSPDLAGWALLVSGLLLLLIAGNFIVSRLVGTKLEPQKQEPL